MSCVDWATAVCFPLLAPAPTIAVAEREMSVSLGRVSLHVVDLGLALETPDVTAILLALRFLLARAAAIADKRQLLLFTSVHE